MSHIRSLTSLLPQPVRFGLRRLAFQGSAGRCELCGNSVRAFHGHGGGHDVLDRRKVVGGMRRANDRCPICHACDRTRMMMMYLKNEILTDGARKSVLHVAPDFGLYLWLKRQANVDYAGSDIDARRYRHIDNVRTADLTATPFDTAQFDVVICSHVLEHIPDDAKAMREILRILKPGGTAMLLVPLALDGLGTDEDLTVEEPTERERLFGQWDHVRLYGRDDYLNRLRAAGFDVSVYAPFEAAPEEAAALRLNPDEVLPIGRKPADA